MSTSTISRPVTTSDRQAVEKMMKSIYQTDQQIKYLHLQAEVEVLWQQLQTMKKNQQQTK
ncbi:MAG: hypothetical protein SAJ37_01660 [Oscillatoria sp. PMC 1068.18]|nr:hypothetical protein [Oscillatoria sp. PMC 1076.18]MEC4987429.1 hypothetical protein [Oscillatoria sp. PMC 1068.18]